MQPTHELYQSLGEAYVFFNRTLFEGKLPDVIFTVQRKTGVMGYFAPDRWGNMEGVRCHEIAINPSYIANSCLLEVMQTLVHEMVHCWQHCFGTPSRRHYHNRQWAQKMINIGLMPSSTGVPGGALTGEHMSDYVLKDGAFLSAFQQLQFHDQFELKWIDRIAAQKVLDPTFYPTDDAALANIKEGAHGASISSQNESLMRPVSENQQNYYPVNQHQSYADVLPQEFLIPLSTRPKSTRTRYVCASCSARVYGKPGLQIQCITCDSPFEPS